MTEEQGYRHPYPLPTVPERPEPSASQVRLQVDWTANQVIDKIDDMVHDYLRSPENRIQTIKSTILLWEESRRD